MNDELVERLEDAIQALEEKQDEDGFSVPHIIDELKLILDEVGDRH